MALKSVCINNVTYQMHQTAQGDSVSTKTATYTTKLLAYDATTGRCLMLIDGRAHQAFAQPTQQGFTLLVNGNSYEVHIAKTLPTHQATAVKPHKKVPQLANTSPNKLTCPLSGKVLAVLCSVGQKVEEGKPLVIVESMKMEHEICAPIAAYVKHISITHGSVVQKGQVLIEFERKGDE